MSEHISIRPAVREDAALVLEFIHSLAEYERLSHEVEATRERLEATLFPVDGTPAAHCVLAYAGTEPVGFAIFFFNYSTFLAKPGLYLEDLFVKPELRGRGAGRALLLHLAGIARERGCGRMEWAVLDWNKPAIGFYESIGARFKVDWKICRLSGASLEGLR
jgi:GNAT superfamily N-acetyltransferase